MGYISDKLGFHSFGAKLFFYRPLQSLAQPVDACCHDFQILATERRNLIARLPLLNSLDAASKTLQIVCPIKQEEATKQRKEKRERDPDKRKGKQKSAEADGNGINKKKHAENGSCSIVAALDDGNSDASKGNKNELSATAAKTP